MAKRDVVAVAALATIMGRGLDRDGRHVVTYLYSLLSEQALPRLRVAVSVLHAYGPWLTGTLLALAVIAMVATPASVAAQSADPTDAGKAVFKRANCFGCHKWHGNGGGGYGGDALSLRKTELTREQIMETVEGGRPGWLVYLRR